MNRPILALFKDSDDELLWAPLLAAVPSTVRMTTSSSFPLALQNLKRAGVEPSVTILSGRLYPTEKPDIVPTVRHLFPETEFLLVSFASDPSPPLQQLLIDRVRNLVINPADNGNIGRQETDLFERAVAQLRYRQAWQIEDHVKPGTRIHEFSVSSSDQKEELIGRLEALISGNSEAMEMLRQKGALLADELFENALFGAPRNAEGRKMYEKGERRSVNPEERILFRFGFDGETLAMEVADSWGSLSPDTVLEHLAQNQEADFLLETGGRGLFIIWRFLDHFHVTIDPGRETVVGGRMKLDSPDDPSAPKGFTITMR